MSGNQIAGLVSLSDLQKLPVRASLFALITSPEMAMALAIERRWPKPDDWMAMLSEGRCATLLSAIHDAKVGDGFVSEIAFTQLHDKADIILKGKLLSLSRGQLQKSFRCIGKLRDNLAHANHYASTPGSAKDVCRTIRSIYETKAELLKVLSPPICD